MGTKILLKGVSRLNNMANERDPVNQATRDIPNTPWGWDIKERVALKRLSLKPGDTQTLRLVYKMTDFPSDWGFVKELKPGQSAYTEVDYEHPDPKSLSFLSPKKVKQIGTTRTVSIQVEGAPYTFKDVLGIVAIGDVDPDSVAELSSVEENLGRSLSPEERLDILSAIAGEGGYTDPEAISNATGEKSQDKSTVTIKIGGLGQTFDAPWLLPEEK